MLSRRTAALLLACSLAGAPAAFSQAPAPATGPFVPNGTLQGVRLTHLKQDLSPVTSVGGGPLPRSGPSRVARSA